MSILRKIEHVVHPIAEVRHNSKKYLRDEYQEKMDMIQRNELPKLVHDYGWDSLKFGIVSWRIPFKGRLLDVGCGIGNFCRFTKAKSIYMDVVGLDKSERAIEISKELAEGGKMDIEFVAGDACNLPFEDNSFDHVVSNDCIEHLRKPIKAIEEIHRVLKPGGQVHITIPWRGIINKRKEPGHIKEWTPEEFSILMKLHFPNNTVVLPPLLTDRIENKQNCMYWFLIIGTK